ncbi:MAG: DUF5034 domain-containing protein [Prevotellaceae bacterium]|jgi:hypothetical protein|nr:DUF5034 domain-containing protein [Prevotellaceae bacterium]
MNKKALGIALCSLLPLLASCSKDEDTPWANEVLTALEKIQVVSYNNAGVEPVVITDGRCPKEAYLLKVQPLMTTDGGSYGAYVLKVAVVATRILTLTDFDARYPAGSQVSELFYQWRTPTTGLPQAFHTLSGQEFRMVLMTYPAPGHYQFRVEFELEDGSVMSADTEPLTFY